jgi:hypothetical protein
MDVPGWLARSIADAERRGLPQLRPLLEALAKSTAALRAADAEFGHPAVPEDAGADVPEHDGGH